MNYIKSKKVNCKNCYKCIRHCPVKSIKFSDQQAQIIDDQCILCGNCFVACSQNAKQLRSDLDRVKEFIASGKPVYASLAPAFAASFQGATIDSMRIGLKQLGFTDVGETALGATLVKKQYEEMIKSKKSRVIISSCCHTVNSLIQKYYPEALPFLADVMSPMQVHCASIKKAHPEAYTVFIGPCISKKEEADLYPGYVDCALTFQELLDWFAENNITLTAAKTNDTEEEGRARLFPITGGIIRSMMLPDSDYRYISIDGIENCKEALSNIINGTIDQCFIEMSACVGSCVGGPASGASSKQPITSYLAIDRYAKEKDFDIPLLPPEDIKKNFHYIQVHTQMPGSSAINEILHKMGKSTPEHELNCGTCGYNTCREKALAVFQGKADLTMCLPFLKEKAENFSDNIIYNTPNGIIVLNEDLEVQQINRAAKELLNIKTKNDILGSPIVRILNPTTYLNVMNSTTDIHDQRIYLAEYQKYVEETVIYDKTYHIIIIIMRDITDIERARQQKEEFSKHTIEITDKVIEKQMRIVQEIASLLGETTAETKIALTKLKETLKNE